MITIIGAGIGGLTTAIALQKQGIPVKIYEQAPSIKAVGAGIILANNAMQVYKNLGISYLFVTEGNAISSMNIVTPQLKVISKADLQYFEEKYRVKNTAIHRGTLQKLLVEELDEGTLELGKQLQSVKRITNSEDTGDGNQQNFQLTFTDGTTTTAAYLIGADGIESQVRQQLFPATEIRYAQQVCWRGLTNFTLPPEYRHELNEAWGKGTRFGFVQIAPNTVYWYALKSYHTVHKFGLHMLEGFFADYHALIREIIKHTPKEKIHTAEITDLKPHKTWHIPQAVLIGDAAHATTPNLGQGACQAIEDAHVLANCFVNYPSFDEAAQKFQELRIKKAHQIVNTSWTIGKVSHLNNGFLIMLRNTAMRMLPKSASRKQSAQIFELVDV